MNVPTGSNERGEVTGMAEKKVTPKAPAGGKTAGGAKTAASRATKSSRLKSARVKSTRLKRVMK